MTLQWRRRGVGTAVGARVTSAVHTPGPTPYYSTDLTNLASQRLALSVGYQPAWGECYAR